MVYIASRPLAKGDRLAPRASGRALGARIRRGEKKYMNYTIKKILEDKISYYHRPKYIYISKAVV